MNLCIFSCTAGTVIYATSQTHKKCYHIFLFLYGPIICWHITLAHITLTQENKLNLVNKGTQGTFIYLAKKLLQHALSKQSAFQTLHCRLGN